MDDSGDDDAIEKVKYKHGIYRYFYLAFAICNYSFMNLFRSSISAITDVLQSQFNTTSSVIGLLSSFFYLSYLLSQLPSGMILQKYLDKYVLYIILIISLVITLCSLLFGLIITNSLIVAIIIRIICGIFGAPCWIMGASITAKYFGNNQVAIGMASMSIIGSLVVLVGTTFQGYLYQEYNIWRVPYYIIAFICMIITLCVILCICCQKKAIIVPENKDNDKLLSQTINDEVDNTEQQNKIDRHSAVYLVISNYLNWCLGIIGFCLFSIFAAFYGLWMVPYLMAKFKFSRSLAVFISLSGNFFGGIGAIIIGYISKKYKKRKILLVLGTLFQFVTLIIIYVPVKYVSNSIFWIIFVTVTNFIAGGFRGCNILTYTLVNEYNFSKKCSDTAQGFVNGITVCSGFVVQFIIGYLLDYHWDHYGQQHKNNDGTRKYDVNDFDFAFSFVIPVCCVVAFCMSLILKETNANKL